MFLVRNISPLRYRMHDNKNLSYTPGRVNVIVMNSARFYTWIRIYLFMRWVAWDLWWSEPFISLPLNIWGLQMVWDRATLLSLSNLNRVLKLNNSLWVASLPMYLLRGKQHEPLCGQPLERCMSSPCRSLSRCAHWGGPAVPSVSFCTSGIVSCWEDLPRFFMPVEI